MTEEKKSKIRKTIQGIEIGLAVILLLYVLIGNAIGNVNAKLFYIVAVGLVLLMLLFNDVVEPQMTHVFENMDSYRKTAFLKYVLWDVASWAGLLYFALKFGEEGNVLVYAGIILYAVACRQKRLYEPVYRGLVTKEDVEAAKSETAEEENHAE